MQSSTVRSNRSRAGSRERRTQSPVRAGASGPSEAWPPSTYVGCTHPARQHIEVASANIDVPVAGCSWLPVRDSDETELGTGSTDIFFPCRAGADAGTSVAQGGFNRERHERLKCTCTSTRSGSEICHSKAQGPPRNGAPACSIPRGTLEGGRTANEDATVQTVYLRSHRGVAPKCVTSLRA